MPVVPKLSFNNQENSQEKMTEMRQAMNYTDNGPICNQFILASNKTISSSLELSFLESMKKEKYPDRAV